MDEIYKLKEMLCKELEEYGKKGDLSTGSLDVVDKLAHATKNLMKIIEGYEDEEYSMAGDSSYRGGMRYSRQGGQGGQGGGSYRGGSYARGRGSNARRDSMGRYSRYDGYSRAEDGMEDVISDLREIMDDLPEEKKREVQKFLTKVEQM